MATNIQSEDADLGFQIAPMIDVVFVLMLFFLACVGSKEQFLKAMLPSPVPSEGTPVLTIDVKITADGSVLANNHLLSSPDDRGATALRSWLNETRASYGTRDPIVIQPAPTVPHARLMEVLNAANAAGWEKVSFR